MVRQNEISLIISIIARDKISAVIFEFSGQSVIVKIA